MEILEGHNKFYVNDADGKQVAEIVFVPTGEHLSIIEHTDVDPSLKGQGVGKKLVAKVVEKMRGEQRKIIPLCPFAKHEFEHTREYEDIRARARAPPFYLTPCYPAIRFRSRPDKSWWIRSLTFSRSTGGEMK